MSKKTETKTAKKIIDLEVSRQAELEKAQAILKEAEKKKVAKNTDKLNATVKEIEADGCELKIFQTTYGRAVVKEEIHIVIKK